MYMYIAHIHTFTSRMATNVRQCACYRSKNQPDERCPNPPSNGSPYCGVHKDCQVRLDQPQPSQVMKTQPRSMKTQPLFDTLDNYTILNMCQQLIDDRKYESFADLVRASKRFKEVCQPLLTKSFNRTFVVKLNELTEVIIYSGYEDRAIRGNQVLKYFTWSPILYDNESVTPLMREGEVISPEEVDFGFANNCT